MPEIIIKDDSFKKTFLKYFKTIPHNRRNLAILKQLAEEEEVEFSEKLVSYLKTTPWNTNLAILKDFGINIEEEEESTDAAVYEYYWTEFAEYVGLEDWSPSNANTTYEGIKAYIQNGDIVKFNVTVDISAQSKGGTYIPKTIGDTDIIFEKEDDPSITCHYDSDGNLRLN